MHLISMLDWFLMMSDIVKLYLFSDWPVDIQIEALLTSFCDFSDIQVTMKAGGPLVYSYCCICFFMILYNVFCTLEEKKGIELKFYHWILFFFIKDIQSIYQYRVRHCHNVWYFFRSRESLSWPVVMGWCPSSSVVF